MRSVQKKSTFAALEQLEARRLLAGNVTVVAEPASPEHIFGFIRIVGDNEDNDITIVANVGNFTVIGNAGTTVTYNGVTGPIANNVLGGGLDVSLGNGDDRVQISGPTTLDSVDISTGNGDDIVLATNMVAQSLAISTGNGEDLVRLQNINLLDPAGLVVDTGNGDDDVTAGLVNATNPNIPAVFRLGKGDDDLLFDGPMFLSGVPGKTIIDGGKGSDKITHPGALFFTPVLPGGVDPFEGFEIIVA
jgi:hypothetical protein